MKLRIATPDGRREWVDLGPGKAPELPYRGTIARPGQTLTRREQAAQSMRDVRARRRDERDE